MIKTYEATGKTVDEAVRNALRDLALTEDDITYEILKLPKSGFLGIGAVPARVKVSFEVPDPEPAPVPAPVKEEKAPEKKPEKPVEKKQPAPAKPKEEPAPRKAPEKKPEKPAEKKPAPEKKAPAEKPAAAEKTESATEPVLIPKPYTPGSREERTAEFLKGLMEHMDIECEITLYRRADGGLDARLDGPDMGAVIGRRGETLDAVQHLVNYTISRGSDKHAHVSVDAEGYRSKREESLVRLAEKMAAKAIKYKRSMALEPMNSYERHVIHAALQDYEGVSTSSTGTEPNRRVVVNYERPAGESEEPRKTHSRPKKAPAREAAPVNEPSPEKAENVAEKPAEPRQPVIEEAPADYTPPTSSKPASREWC